MTIGEKILSIREDLNLNQMEFAKLIGTSQSHISNIEKGRKEISDILRKSICFHCFVNEEWLLYGVGDKYNEAARGFILSDIGNKDEYLKLAAISIAAKLFSIYPSISIACDSVDSFLDLFKDSDFCDSFNVLALSYLEKRHDINNDYFSFMNVATSILKKQLVTEDRIKAERVNLAINRSSKLAEYLNSIQSNFDLGASLP